MFSKGTNRNHYLLITLRDQETGESRTYRDPWMHRGIVGEFVDERLRRIVLSVIRTETGPNTKKRLATGLVEWCLMTRIGDLPEGDITGDAVFGQEVFSVENLQPKILTKYRLSLKRERDGRFQFTS